MMKDKLEDLRDFHFWSILCSANTSIMLPLHRIKQIKTHRHNIFNGIPVFGPFYSIDISLKRIKKDGSQSIMEKQLQFLCSNIGNQFAKQTYRIHNKSSLYCYLLHGSKSKAIQYVLLVKSFYGEFVMAKFTVPTNDFEFWAQFHLIN